MSFQKQQSTLDNALTLLEIISHYSSGISLADIVKLSQMAKTTVFRILDILKKDNISAMMPPLKNIF
ncbi:hypothetical protein B5S42_02235 [Gilliamella apicola]|nr:hypothetical protein B5S42_02235 [Gilliamella apicola]OTQ13060.1 hypothetical protein B6C87_03440 [Gilliamella apicola]PXZ02915.1 hypothetical protein DKK69_00230 [Gilliamella apicola]